MPNLPIKGWPRGVIDNIDDIVSDLIRRQEVNEFYIGRTNNLTATISRHNADRILVLYETVSADNAIDVKNILIKTFFDHPKCSNDIGHGGGGASDEYINWVYIAIWYK